MKVKEISVSYGVTLSYAKYRFIRLEYTMGAELTKEDDAAPLSLDLLRLSLRDKLEMDARKEVEAWRKLGAQVEALGETPAQKFDFD